MPGLCGKVPHSPGRVSHRAAITKSSIERPFYWVKQPGQIGYTACQLSFAQEARARPGYGGPSPGRGDGLAHPELKISRSTFWASLSPPAPIQRLARSSDKDPKPRCGRGNTRRLFRTSHIPFSIFLCRVADARARSNRKSNRLRSAMLMRRRSCSWSSARRARMADCGSY